jgi:hypothetical protein
MTSPFAPDEEMSPQDRRQYGVALVKDAAFDAVYGLWTLRKSQGWTNATIAENVDVDEGWLSKQFAGPRNWTTQTMGTLVEGLHGLIEIKVYPIESAPKTHTNFDAYAEYEEPVERKSSSVPRARKGVDGSLDDPSTKQLVEMISQRKAPVPVPGV